MGLLGHVVFLALSVQPVPKPPMARLPRGRINALGPDSLRRAEFFVSFFFLFASLLMSWCPNFQRRGLPERNEFEATTVCGTRLPERWLDTGVIWDSKAFA